MSFFGKGLIAVLVLCGVLGAQARDTQNPPLVLDDFPGARLVFSSRENTNDYVLALGNYKKVRGLWRVDEQRLSGELIRKTYQLPDNHSALDGYRFFVDQLQKYPLRELYTCEARECGDSNSWAINHFNILQLYGLDQYQYFGTYELTAPEHAGVYVTLYSVLRGNKRVYVQLEILLSDSASRYQVASNPTTLVRQLTRDGFTVFAGLRYAGQGQTLSLAPSHVKALADALAREPQLKVALVGHNYERQPLATQRQVSLGYAELLQKALVEQGVSADRLEVVGLGALAPAGRGDAEARLDVVLLRTESAP